MTDEEKAIDEFVKFTCSTEAEARNYLQTAGWSTEAALATYFDDRDDRVDPSTLGNISADNPIEIDSDNDSYHMEEVAMDDDPSQAAGAKGGSDKKTQKSEPVKTYKPASNITTFSSLRNNRETEEEEDDDEQLYYAGGSEHSGQQIMGNDRRADMAGEVFKHLKQMVTVGEVELAGPSRERKSHFSGVGYRLGQTPEDSQVVENASSRPRQNDRPELHLRLWRDGFSIGDEALRPYTDRENREIIEHILRGEVPKELVPPGTASGMVNVKVEDMRHASYTAPTSRGKFFTGQGHVLGNVVPVVKSEPTVKPPEAPSEKPAAPPAAVEVPSPISLNDSAPCTSVAVRLPSGTRSQVRLNLTHTVEDLRTHLTTVHRELDGQTFVFMVNFPPKEVSDEKLSISDAGLVNSSVHLRIKKD